MAISLIIKNLKKLNINFFKNFFLNKIEINHEIDFGTNIANSFFIKTLSKSNYYFELGSGKSTFLADKLNKNFYSIETSKSFYNFVKSKLKKRKNLKFISLGIVGNFSYPIFLYKTKAKNYINFINNFLNLKNFPDFILVDGRYRVLTSLHFLKHYKKLKKTKTCILLDDFVNRDCYKILRKFYKIKIIGRMAKLEPKPVKYKILNKYIHAHYLDAR